MRAMRNEKVAIALLCAGLFLGRYVWCDPAKDEQARAAAAAKARYRKMMTTRETPAPAEEKAERPAQKSAYEESAAQDWSSSYSSSSSDE